MDIRKSLSSLYYLHTEIRHLRERIAELQSIVTGTVKPMTGMPKGSKPNDNMERLIDMKIYLEKQLHKRELMRDICERFINDIQDGQTRLIFRLRYIDGLTWNQVADEICGGNTEDSVRMRASRYLDDYER